MLVVDSAKRMSVEQIVAHRWMHPQGEEEEEEEFHGLLQEYNTRPPPSPGVPTDTDDTGDPLYEQVLDYMTHLGLDRQRTAEVCSHLCVCECVRVYGVWVCTSVCVCPVCVGVLVYQCV